MSRKYRNIKCLVAGLDNTVGKVYPVLRVEASWIVFIDDADEVAHLGTESLMLGKWEPTDDEVTV